MKTFLFILFLSATTFAQPTTKSYQDFELLTPAKSIKDIKVQPPKNYKFVSFEKAIAMYDDTTVKKYVDNEIQFNNAGLLQQQIKFYNGSESYRRDFYVYDDKNQIINSTSERKEGDQPFIIDAITTTAYEDNLVTQTTVYGNHKDSIYVEKFIVKNNRVIQELDSEDNKVRESRTYDAKGNLSKIATTFANGAKMQTNFKYAYHPNGKIKTETATQSGLFKDVLTQAFLENGLLHKKTSGKGTDITFYEYKYDNHGNWIYKIEYRNGEPEELVKREIVY